MTTPRLPIAACLAATALTLTACESGEQTSDAELNTAPAQLEVAMTPADELDRRYVVGRRAANRLGYRIDWQAYTAGGEPVSGLTLNPESDSLMVVDDGNEVMRIDLDSGRRKWAIPIADTTAEVLAVQHAPDFERVIVTTPSVIYVLDDATGSEINHRRQQLPKAAATAPVWHGGYLVYGARNGQLIWRSTNVGAEWRAYQLANAISVQPVYEDGYLVGVGSGGRVMAINAGSASQVWTQHALDEVVAAPAINDGIVYVPSLDQHLRAYDAQSPRPRPMWEYLTEAALVDSPVVVEDRVYQQVPGAGLLCFEANPVDSPGGVLIWKCGDATGNVLTQRGSNLLVWDDNEKRLGVIDVRLGEVIETWTMPAVDHLIADSTVNGAIYATGHDGRVIRLEPTS